MVTRAFPTQARHPQARVVHLLIPAFHRMRRDQVGQFLLTERGEFIRHSRHRTAREQLHRLFRRKLLQIVMQPRQQRDHRDRLPPGPTRHMPDLGWEEHHVQNHSIVGPVRGVAMGDPIRSTQVKFDIAR